MKDSVFLEWLANRLINLYDESENVDFVLKLKRIAALHRVLEHGDS